MLSKALEERGFSNCLIYQPNWKIERGSTEQLVSLVAGAIRDMDPTTIIYQFGQQQFLRKIKRWQQNSTEERR
jgi:hypothetical protein